QLLQELCFGVVAFARSLQRLLFAVRAAESNQKNPRMLRVQTGRFQIELQTMQRIERQLFEVRAPGRDQVLLLGRQSQHRLGAEFPQMGDGPRKSVSRALQHSASQRARILRTHEVAKARGPFQLSKTDAVRAWLRAFRLQAGTE